MSESTFVQETARKEKLLNLFEGLEKREIHQTKQSNNLKFGKYDRVFNGVARVAQINKSSLRLIRENNEQLGTLAVTPEIAGLSKKNDEILLSIGYRHNQWHPIFVQLIGSQVSDSSDGPPKVHLSGANPFGHLPL